MRISSVLIIIFFKKKRKIISFYDHLQRFISDHLLPDKKNSMFEYSIDIRNSWKLFFIIFICLLYLVNIILFGLNKYMFLSRVFEFVHFLAIFFFLTIFIFIISCICFFFFLNYALVLWCQYRMWEELNKFLIRLLCLKQECDFLTDYLDSFF